MDSAKTVLVGLGNADHGDDAIGLIVARHLSQTMEYRDRADLLELSTCGFGVMEHLLGYRKAVMIDALVDENAALGAVKRMPVAGAPCEPCISFHTVGFDAALALARLLDLPVPHEIAMYGIVIRDPWNFSARLSPELEARLPRIFQAFKLKIGSL